MAALRRARRVRHLDHPRDAGALTWSCIGCGARAQHRGLAAPRAGRRPLRVRLGRGVLRRIDVQPRARCLQGGARAPGGAVPAQQSGRDRLPAALAAPAQPRRTHLPQPSSRPCCESARAGGSLWSACVGAKADAPRQIASSARFMLQFAPLQQLKDGMSKEDAIQMEGEVAETLPNTTFRVKLEERPHRDRAHLRQDAQELHPHPHRRRTSPWR